MSARMNPEIKAQWVAALRSGEFAQGFSALHSQEPVGYCCLGVLCVLAQRAGIVEASPESNGLVRYGTSDDSTEVAYLPQEVITWAGLAGRNPRVSATGPYGKSLSQMNDEGAPFSVIADHIEEYL